MQRVRIVDIIHREEEKKKKKKEKKMADTIEEITKELKNRGYTLIPRLAGNDARLKAENLRWRVTSDHIDWDWDFKTLEEVVGFIGKEKEIFRQVYRRLTK